MPHRGTGPAPSRLMIVGEAWGKDEEERGEPFVGASGQELNRMLHDAGLMRSEAFCTNVVNHRPRDNKLREWIAYTKDDRTPEHVQWKGWFVKPIVIEGYKQLLAEIEMVKPNVIIPVGNLALHALREGCIKMKPKGPSGILKWRGSQLRMDGSPTNPKVIPTVHPAYVLRQWSERYTAVQDLRRVARHLDSREYSPPKWNFRLRPSFTQVITTLRWLRDRAEEQTLWVELDLETRAGHIACLGLSWSLVDALCIPFMCVENKEGYWNPDEEAFIIWELYQLLGHPRTKGRVKVRWQNGLYDAQYIFRHWHFVPHHEQDTMISQHAVYSDQPKALAYIASIHCDWYVYWKDEGKEWDKKMGEEQLWSYNCQDDVYTRECGESLLQTISRLYAPPRGIQPWAQVHEIHAFQQKMFWPVLRAMQIGLRIRPEARNALAGEVQEQIDLRQGVLEQIIERSINVDSPKQMQQLFYEELAQPIIWKRVPGEPPRPTCDDEALMKIASREPLMKPLVNCIADIRTLGKYMDVILMKLDNDGRGRCAFNIGGSESGKSAPKTYRLSSSKSAFDSGANLQNISSEKSKSAGKAVARGHLAMLGDPYILPNIRTLFGPDAGFTFFDQDLERADLFVVVWESDDRDLKLAMRAGVDIHLFNVYTLDGKEPPPLDELVEGHPRYLDHRGPRKTQREFAKIFCHGTNYLGSARTMAAHTGRLVHEVERAQRIWFGAHPGIQRWHGEVQNQISKRRYVENKFGYRWYIFDRIDSALSEAVAWIPQSTVSIAINKVWMNHYERSPQIQVLLQVHDSLAGQFPTHMKERCVKELKENAARVIIPYDDPLIIPTGLGLSEVSWGDC